VRPAPSPSRQYARLRDMMVDTCMLPDGRPAPLLAVA
jgi:hypothetical protein